MTSARSDVMPDYPHKLLHHGRWYVPVAEAERLRGALTQILAYSDAGESWLAISQTARDALASDITAHTPDG